jgi:acrylyl-CoA reductase (NADPH)
MSGPKEDSAMTFKALVATRENEALSTKVTDFDDADLMPGDVTVTVDYSTVNYKDAGALSGQIDVIKQFR